MISDDEVARFKFDALNVYGLLVARLCKRLIPYVSRNFDVRRVYPIWTPGITPPNPRSQAFEDKIEQAAEDGIITDDDETRMRVTDLVLRAQRKGDRSTLWFAVEASGVINYEDITRVKRSADAIAKMYEQDAVPIVYGYRIDHEQRELADQLEVAVFLDSDAE